MTLQLQLFIYLWCGTPTHTYGPAGWDVEKSNFEICKERVMGDVRVYFSDNRDVWTCYRPSHGVKEE